jgi:hypothetical protein
MRGYISRAKNQPTTIENLLWLYRRLQLGEVPRKERNSPDNKPYGRLSDESLGLLQKVLRFFIVVYRSVTPRRPYPSLPSRV